MAELRLADYRPRQRLRRPEHRIEKPRFPVVDAHNHLGPEFSDGWDERPVAELLAALDEAGVETIVDLDGGQGAALSEHIARYQAPCPDRIVVMAQLAYDEWAERPDFGEMEAQRFEDSARRGARGIKVWKHLGLRARDPQGQVVAVDDERLDPFWTMGAKLGLPIVVHVADPIAFFDPLDERNERWEELAEHPDWHFWPPRAEAGEAAAEGQGGFAAFDEILAAFDRVIGRHPETTFIGAHVGCAAEDLALVSSMLDRHPNYHVDISARMAELGRQPYTARAFFLRHADRILFGTDMGYDPEMYRVHYRFLETMDESFDYSIDETPPQGRWQICGLGLPDDVLRKVYADNARRLILKAG
jgi:predicted TIM-barrel fold metal-dependent hydrolase